MEISYIINKLVETYVNNAIQLGSAFIFLSVAPHALTDELPVPVPFI